MPWDPKPAPPEPAQPAHSAPAPNGLPSSSYTTYDTPPSSAAANGGPRIKQEPGTEPQYNGYSNGYPQNTGPTQGGLARAQHLVQQQYGPSANASLTAMQRAGGLALPGQQQQQAKPQGLHLPGGQMSPTAQQQYASQQQQAMQQAQAQQRAQQQMQQQQNQPRVKVENESPQMPQGAFPPASMPTYSQTDGADDAQEQWQTMLAQRRALHAQHGQHADHMMRDHALQVSAELQSGLMMPLNELPSHKRKRAIPAIASLSNVASSSKIPSIPQLDGDVDDEDVKPEIKEEDDDENAINSDLDDSEDDDKGPLGEDDDDNVDTILCTYDKVQRVKNKWKCTSKDGVMSVGGKEWVFHKGTGEFEW